MEYPGSIPGNFEVRGGREIQQGILESSVRGRSGAGAVENGGKPRKCSADCNHWVVVERWGGVEVGRNSGETCCVFLCKLKSWRPKRFAWFSIRLLVIWGCSFASSSRQLKSSGCDERSDVKGAG